MAYYEATDLFEIEKVTGKKVYIRDVNNKYFDGYVDDIKMNDLDGFIFEDILYDEDEDEYYVEVVYWDNVFEYRDRDGYYDGGYTPVYGDDGVLTEVFDRDDAEGGIEGRWTKEAVDKITVY